MAGLSFSFEDVLGRKKRQKREAEAASLGQGLLERGAEPDAVNAITQHYLQTGEFQAPEFQTKNLPPTNLFPEGIPTRQPFSMEPKKKGLFTMDARSGKMTQVQTPDDMRDYEVKSYNDTEGHSWKIDRATGQRQDMGANGKSYDTYVYWNSKEGQGGGGKDSPDVELAKDTVKKYQDAKKKGDPLTDEFIQSARSAFDMLKIPFTEEEQPPTVMEGLRNKASELTKGKIAPAEKRYSDPVAGFDRSNEAEYGRDLEAARKAVAQKLVTPQDAVLRLQRKYGKRVKGL